MKIDTVTTGAVSTKGTTGMAKAAGQGKASALRRDRVDFSSDLSRLQKAMARIPEDPSRVDELKGAISTGTYNVPGTVVAEKMLQSSLTQPN